MRDDLGVSSVMLLFLLLVVLVSVVGGLLPGLSAAVAGFLLVNWYFLPPLYTFSIGDTEHLLALFVFLAVAALVSAFVSLAAQRAIEGARARAEAEALVRLAGSSPVPALLEAFRRVLGLDGVSILHREETGWRVDAVAGERSPESPEAAAEVVELDEQHLLALTAEVADESRRILGAFVAELVASLELEELEAEASTAAALASAGELRTAILSAVSHDLRTPISAIKASVSSLLQQDVDWTPEARREFLDTIDEEVDRLNALVGNLLDMSRLQAGAVETRRDAVGLEEVIPAALRSLGVRGDAVELDVPETLPRVVADAGLLERALANIFDNAVRHSPPGRRVRVLAGAANGTVDVRVVDRGDGLPEEERARMFLPFQRLGDSGDDGVGLGLAVAKGFVEAMGGELETEDTPGGGLTMVVHLPSAP